MGLFDDDMILSGPDSLKFGAQVSGNWSVNGNPNGGYLMALLVQAMLRETDKRSAPIITANYISRCAPGEAEIRLEEISRSAQFTRYEARLYQDGKERIRTLGTFTGERNECSLDRYESGAPALSPVGECVPVPPYPGYTLFHNLDMRLDPSCAGWMQGRVAERSEQKGWVRFRDERPFDLPSLFLMADSIPPAVFVTQGPTAWVPTVELSVNIRNMPATSWLLFSLRTRFITCGLLEADGEVWDEEGSLVSISRQVAQFRR